LSSEIFRGLSSEVCQAGKQILSDLVRGKIHLFSIDTLVKLLAAAGFKVNLRVTRAA
jgi:predicted XRE-type DNA-binding protein